MTKPTSGATAQPADGERAKSSFFAFTANRPVAIIMIVLGVFTFGCISLGKLPVNLLPDISYPTITVRTEYPAAAPEDVEERVSKKIHEALSVLPSLEQISSVSKSGLSDVVLEFSWGTNIPYATQNIREKLDLVELPEDTERPVILRYDPTLDPIIRIGVFESIGDVRTSTAGGRISTAGGLGLAELRKIAEDEVQRRLETIEGVAAVKVRGGLEEEIRIEVNGFKLRELDLDISEIERRLSQENINMAGGTIREGDVEYLVRTLNQFQNLDEINALVIRRDAANAIRLGDIAGIRKFHKERDVISRINGRESVEIQVFKEADANIVTVAEKVRELLLGTAKQRKYRTDLLSGAIKDPEKALKEARATKEEEREKAPKEPPQKRKDASPQERKSHSRGRNLASMDDDPELAKLRGEVENKHTMLSFINAQLPPGCRARVLSDQSRFIQDSIREVKDSAILGGILAVLVLYIFLRNFVSTTIIALAIPISVIATFAPMYLTKTSLNIMSLGGLALGIGMLVDNSIIVLESIFRCREEGHSLREAAVRGVSEIGSAATASTLTTVAVFFPIAFVEGIAGQIFRDQALTVVFSLLVSLAVALFFIPMLASRQLPEKRGEQSVRCTFRAFGLYIKYVIGDKERREHLRERHTPFRDLFRKVIVIPMKAVFLFPPFLLNLSFESLGLVLYYLNRFLFKASAVLLGVILVFIKIVLYPFTKLYNKTYALLMRIYPRILRTLLTSRSAALFLLTGTIAALAAAVIVTNRLGQELLPEVHQGELIAHISMPPGTPLEKTSRFVNRAEESTLKTELVEWVSSSTGVPRDEIAGADEGEHTSKLFLKIKTGRQIREDEEKALASLRRIYTTYPGLHELRFSRPTLFSFKAPLQVDIKGRDLDKIAGATRKVETLLKSMPGLTDIRSTVHKGTPEIIIRLDREELTRYGLDTFTVADRITKMVKGKVPTLFQSGERKVDILVRLEGVDSGNAEDLGNMAVNPESSAPLPLSAVADIEIREGPGEIRRIWGQRAAIVNANLTGFDMGGTARKIRNRLVEIREGTNLNLEIGGQGREMEGALENMKLALYLAIFLVYVVMASQFESLIQPFIIICTIPLAFVGVVLVLWLLDIPLSVVVFIGAIMLAGIVVNNAIVLIDYINRLRDRGLEKKDAIVQACSARLRPVLMTTATTVLGLLPLTGILGLLPYAEHFPLGLGMGEGAEIRAPMAVTVIAGLLSSALLTFFVIPLVYSLVVRSRKHDYID